MFIQVIQGNVTDAAHYRRVATRWRTELKPGAKGYLGSTDGVTPDGRSIAIVRFDDEESARRNSARPEQGAWWSEMAKSFTGEVTFHDCREVDVLLGGGSDQAGFVQVMQGKTKDQKAFRALQPKLEASLRADRPDVLGAVVAWHGDGSFTQAVYFASQEAARAGEQATANSETRQEMMAQLDGPMTFLDLPEPMLD